MLNEAPTVIDKSYVYEPGFIDDAASAEILAWLDTLHPLWEMRYSTRRLPPAGSSNASQGFPSFSFAMSMTFRSAR